MQQLQSWYTNGAAKGVEGHGHKEKASAIDRGFFFVLLVLPLDCEADRIHLVFALSAHVVHTSGQIFDIYCCPPAA